MGRRFHILTDGTSIPTALNDRDRNRHFQQFLAREIPDEIDREEVQINRGYLNYLRNNAIEYERVLPEENELLEMFLPMACLGFYSYDCVAQLYDGRGLYMLVAYPSRNNDNHKGFDQELLEFRDLQDVTRSAEGIVESFVM